MAAPQGQSGGDNLNVGQVSVGTSATLIAAARGESPANGPRISITVTNLGSATVFIAPTIGVTAATGHGIPAGQAQSFPYTGPVYGIAASSQTVSFAESF